MSNNGTLVKQDEINVYVFAKCRHECDKKNTQCNALNVLRVHTDNHVHLNRQHPDRPDTTRYHGAVTTDTRR
jgi:hypothetical protein